jgi:hypothetical protein
MPIPQINLHTKAPLQKIGLYTSKRGKDERETMPEEIG